MEAVASICVAFKFSTGGLDDGCRAGKEATQGCLRGTLGFEPCQGQGHKSEGGRGRLRPRGPGLERRGVKTKVARGQ